MRQDVLPKGERIEDNVPFERLEKVYVPDEDPSEERMNIFHRELCRDIKRKLWSRRNENPTRLFDKE